MRPTDSPHHRDDAGRHGQRESIRPAFPNERPVSAERCNERDALEALSDPLLAPDSPYALAPHPHCPAPCDAWEHISRADTRPTRDIETSQLGQLGDEELIRRSREQPEQAAQCLDLLFERVYPHVARWCLRFCRDRDDAADLAQDVVLRAYTRLASFRFESAFLTWMYTITRRTAIDRTIKRRRDASRFAPPEAAELLEQMTMPSDVELMQMGAAVRNAMVEDLDPVAARVIYLHYVDGLSLQAITGLLGLENKSGAKAHLVRGMKKLCSRFRPSSDCRPERASRHHG